MTDVPMADVPMNGIPVAQAGAGRAAPEARALRRTILPVGTVGHRASGWFGMWGLVVTEAALFAYLLFSYFYDAAQHHGAWPPDGPLSLRLALPNTIVLLASSAVVFWGESGMRKGRRWRAVIGLAGGVVLGCIFVGVQLLEWKGQAFTFRSSLYGAQFFTVTGFHMAHVIAGILVLAVLTVWSALGYFDRVRHAPVSIGALYWHFVDAVWVVVFTSLYLLPHLGR